MTDKQTTTDHVRIIAEAMGWAAEQIVTFSGNEAVAVVRPVAGILESYRLDDLLVFTAHAVAWAAGKGWYRDPDFCDGWYMTFTRFLYPDQRAGGHTYDPEDPHDAARATLAAVAEVVGMLNEGGE